MTNGDAQLHREPEEARGTRGRRRQHRRASAPPTNPSADQADDVAERGVRRLVGHGDDHAAADSPRDRWIKAQRPPHWD